MRELPAIIYLTARLRLSCSNNHTEMPAVQLTDDLAERNQFRRARQTIAAVASSLAFHESTVPEVIHDLLQELFRDIVGRRDFRDPQLLATEGLTET